jgi:hypothetical protein
MLHRMEAQLPSLDESAACAQKLKSAMFEGVGETDMRDIMAGIVKKAKGGDLGAAKLLMEFVRNSGIKPQVSIGIRSAGPSEPTNGNGAVHLLPRAEAQTAQSCARLLGKLGPQTAADLAELSGYSEEAIEFALKDHARFERLADGRVRLSAIGRRELLPALKGIA